MKTYFWNARSDPFTDRLHSFVGTTGKPAWKPDGPAEKAQRQSRLQVVNCLFTSISSPFASFAFMMRKVARTNTTAVHMIASDANLPGPEESVNGDRTTGRYAATEPKDGVGRQGRSVLERSHFGQELLGKVLSSPYSWRVIVNEKRNVGTMSLIRTSAPTDDASVTWRRITFVDMIALVHVVACVAYPKDGCGRRRISRNLPSGATGFHLTCSWRRASTYGSDALSG